MINRIVVRSIGSYGEETPPIEFGRGKNVIVGENGAGKTALLFAIEVGFLGSLEEWDLRDVINDDSDEGEVTIDFTHPKTGETLQIYRKFKRVRSKKKGKEGGEQVEVYLKNLDTGELLADKPKSVENLLKAIGINKNIFLNVIHIKQGKINRILRSSATQREIFDELFGIHGLKNALSELGSKRGNTYSGLLRELDNKRRINESTITAKLELAGEYERKKAELEKLKEMLARYEEEKRRKEEKLRKLNELWGTVKPLAEKVSEAVNKIATFQSSLDQINSTLIKLYNQLKREDLQLFLEIEGILKKVEETQEPYLEKEVIEVLHQRVEEIEKEEEKLTDLIKKRDELEKEVRAWIGKKSALESEIKKLESQMKRIQDFIKGKERLEEIKCELCGSLLKPSAYSKHLEEIRLQVNSKREELRKEIEPLLEKVEEEKSKLSEEIEKINKLVNKKTTIFSLLKIVDDQLEKKIECTAKLREEKRKLQDSLKELKEVFGEEITIENIGEKISSIETQLNALPVKIEEIVKNIDHLTKEQIPSVEEEVEKRKKAKEEVEKLRKENEKLNRKIDFLIKEIRPALNDVQPVIRRLFIDNINRRAMMYFEKFYGKESRYKREDIRRIWMDDEYRFWVDRLGHIKQATRLSGGQGIIVSLCFLFALLDELGSSLGFLLLDEPSTHLSNKSVEELIEVLKSLQNIPQLIIVDHKQELIDAADIKYEVSLVNGFSQIRRIE